MTFAELVARPGHWWINNQVELNTARYSPGFQTNAGYITIRSFSQHNATWRPALIPRSLICRKLKRRRNLTVLSVGTNQPGNTMELAHAKVVKVSSSARFETALHTRAEEITIVLWTEIIGAAARLVDFKNVSTQEWRKKVLIVFFKNFNMSSMHPHNIYILKRASYHKIFVLLKISFMYCFGTHYFIDKFKACFPQ